MWVNDASCHKDPAFTKLLAQAIVINWNVLVRHCIIRGGQHVFCYILVTYSSECTFSSLVPHGNRTHNPGIASAMLYELSHTVALFFILFTISINNVPIRILCIWFSAGWFCWPGILQLGDIHIPAGFKSQMAWPHHTFKRKPRKQADNPSVWILWWDFLHH